jgi:hypothetical protein
MKAINSWVGRFTTTVGAAFLLLAATDQPPVSADTKSTTGENPVVAEGVSSPVPDAEVEKVELVSSAVGKLPADFKPSPALSEIIKLAQAGVGDEVLLAFIAKSGQAFELTPDEIIFLRDLGVSEEVITAMIKSQGIARPAGTAVAPAPASAQPAQVAPALAAPAPNPQPPALNGAVAQPAPDAPPAPASEATQITPPAQQVTVNHFYDSLAPYGNWVNVAGFGLCWQPAVAVIDVNWRPYFDNGRWLYSNHGWYWHSNYSWGWAPFHYGRWHRHAHRGWLWLPDTYWGPSWVTWRYTDGYCGWAPLPPRAGFGVSFGFGVNFDFGLSYHHYAFVPASRFCDRAVYRHHVPRDKHQNVFKNSVVINNYIKGDNNIIINEGIGRDRIVRETRTEVPRIIVRDAEPGQARMGRVERLVNENNKLVLYRPAPLPVSADARADRSPGFKTLGSRLTQDAKAQAVAPVPAEASPASPSRATSSRLSPLGKPAPKPGFTAPKTGSTKAAEPASSTGRPGIGRLDSPPLGSRLSRGEAKPDKVSPEAKATPAPAPAKPENPSALRRSATPQAVLPGPGKTTPLREWPGAQGSSQAPGTPPAAVRSPAPPASGASTEKPATRPSAPSIILRGAKPEPSPNAAVPGVQARTETSPGAPKIQPGNHQPFRRPDAAVPAPKTEPPPRPAVRPTYTPPTPTVRVAPPTPRSEPAPAPRAQPAPSRGNSDASAARPSSRGGESGASRSSRLSRGDNK